MKKETASKKYMESLYWTPLKDGETDSDIEVKYTLGQAKSLAENSFKSGWEARGRGLIEYIYEFAWHYGRLFHLENAEKIKAAISEKFMLPEEWLNSDTNDKPSSNAADQQKFNEAQK